MKRKPPRSTRIVGSNATLLDENSCEINVHVTFLFRAVTNSTGDFLRKSRLKKRHKSYAASPTDSLTDSFTRFTFAIFLIRLGESPVSHSCPRLILVADRNLQVLTNIHTCIVEIFLFPWCLSIILILCTGSFVYSNLVLFNILGFQTF